MQISLAASSAGSPTGLFQMAFSKAQKKGAQFIERSEQRDTSPPLSPTSQTYEHDPAGLNKIDFDDNTSAPSMSKAKRFFNALRSRLSNTQKPERHSTCGSIRVRILYQAPTYEAPGSLTVKILEAKELLAMDLNGSSDPFVKIMFGTERKRTTVVRKNLNPVWNESFKFEVPCLADNILSRELVIEVWDWDRVGRDDFIGQRIWILEQLADGVPLEDWFELKGERVDVESHVKILQALHQSSLRRRAREDEIVPERRMIILNAKRRRIFREKQRVVEAGWAEVLDENARKSLRQQLENEIYLILILLIEFCLVLWTIVWNDL